MASLLERKNVAVIVTEVYNPFNKESVFFKLPNSQCGILNIPERPLANCYERVSYAVTKLNDALYEIYDAYKQSKRLQITALEGLFNGHESPKSNQDSEKCGNATPDIANTWIQYNGDPNSFANPDINPSLIPGEWKGDCFHPNETGAQEIAKAINNDALRLGR